MTIKKIYYKTHWGVNVINQGFCFCIINRPRIGGRGMLKPSHAYDLFPLT
jgi:hypothetical protein